MTLPPVTTARFLEHGLPAVAEARRLDGADLQDAPETVDHERREGLAVNVLGHDDERTAGTGHLLEHREHVPQVRDLLLVDQDERILELHAHVLGVGDEVGRKVSLVELQALDEVELRLGPLRLFHGDHAVLADFGHRIGEEVADLLVLVRGDGPDLGDLLPVGADLLAEAAEALFHRGRGLVEPALQRHRVGPGDHHLEAFTEDAFREDRGGGRAVAGDVGGLAGDLVDELRAHVLERVGKLDLLGNAHAVLRDGRRAETLLHDDVLAGGPECDLHGAGELLHAGENLPQGLLVEHQLLGHLISLLGRSVTGGSPECRSLA
jgi:hypothetical protein